MKYIFLTFSLITICIKAQNSVLDSIFTSDFHKNQWVGFYLYEPIENAKLYDFQGDKYFIPASNTKIFTLFAGLKMLSDSIPALNYLTVGDTLYIKGTGDPTLLQSHFKSTRTIDFLKNRTEKIALYLNNFDDTKSGNGWAWDDYAEDFSAERSVFPMYGNVVQVHGKRAYPDYFSDKIFLSKNLFARDLIQNIFHGDGEIPFITSDTLTRKLLEIEISKPVGLTHRFPKKEVRTLYSIPTDSLLKHMMLVSSNFLAEQILVMSSSKISDNLSGKMSIQYLLARDLQDLPQKPRWVDGSGLSRYNNFSPQDMVFILNKMYHEVQTERLLNFFPIGGVSGTLSGSFKGNPPYVYAKTGSMSGVYNLSGFIKTHSGRILIFSFMNNNFQHSNSEIKAQMEKILQYVRDSY
ncbi:MAG: D-alanyl-D-alanine carboxypeptidase [Flavobacteriaceae bacterium]|jgi:D-alanyl-D-alanine carboxypeptidase/D-alanyl-D-alanine-endopeptidase (penicillin-binding protein 4)|nr:D-alanyl-D-alanine carboxypeptidase [Flavobacteriaceae bacterium]